MTIAQLALIISVVCKLNYSNGIIPEEQKLDCIDRMVNCSVKEGGKIDKEVVKECSKNERLK